MAFISVTGLRYARLNAIKICTNTCRTEFTPPACVGATVMIWPWFASRGTKHNFDPPHNNMGHHLKSGILNSGGVQIIRVFCQFASLFILSRLLSPAEFGIFAMAGPVYGFATLFQDLGLSQASVQKPTLNYNEVNAFFWINAVMGTALAIFIVALSPAIGWYYHDARVASLSAAMGVLIMVNSLGSQSSAILTRRMEFKTLFITSIVGTVVNLLVSIILAYILKDFWALYYGLFAGTLIPVIWVFVAARWKPSFPTQLLNVRGMLKFGLAVSSSSLSVYVSRNADNMLIGRRWGDLALGLYDRAYKLLLFPLQRIVGPVVNTLIPILSRITDEPDRYRSIYVKTMGQLVLLTWPGIVWAFMFSDILVPVLLGQQWIEASRIFKPLAFAGFLQALNESYGCLLITQGRSGELAKWSLFEAITNVAAFLVGLPHGVFGVAVAYAVSEGLRTPLLWLYITRQGPIKLRDIVLMVAPQLLSVMIAAVTLVSYRHYTGSVSSIPGLAFGLVLSYLITFLTLGLTPQGRKIFTHAMETGQHLLKVVCVTIKK